jgi:trans-aconitate methyltransferase
MIGSGKKQMLEGVHQEMANNWDHAHRYSPAPRHRRRIILKWLAKLTFKTCLDAGCAQAYLLQEIMMHHSKIEGYGCDISKMVVADNRNRFPQCEFKAMDIAKEAWQKQFDLVVSSEVIEHIPQWRDAIHHLASMSRRYLFLTVPSGKLNPLSRMVGHTQHFEGSEIQQELEKNGFKCLRMMRYGFPVHSLYEFLINLAPNKLFQSFQACSQYSLSKKIFCYLLYISFFINDGFRKGNQLFILAERQET